MSAEEKTKIICGNIKILRDQNHLTQKEMGALWRLESKVLPWLKKEKMPSRMSVNIRFCFIAILEHLSPNQCSKYEKGNVICHKNTKNFA